jgi:GDP-4-dehydro-6-deoxy-D-mannose reductase
MKKKVAFITGITGMVGSHLAEYIYNNTDWDIIGMIRWRSALNNLSGLIDDINKKNRVRLVYADLRDSVAVNNAISQFKIDYIFHLAAQSYPLTSFTSPIDTLDTNVQGTFRILEATKNFNNDAVVHICSSSEIFGRVKKSDLPIKENCSFHPASPYAISKIGTDMIGRFFAEAYDMKVLTTRMFTHTGPRRGDVFAESSFAKQIAMAEKELIPPIIKVGNLKSLRTIADVRDAVAAYYLLVTKNPLKGEFYNIGGNHTCTIEEILNYLISLSTLKNIKIEIDPERIRPLDADLQVPDTKKFKDHTGWEPKYTFENTMKDLLDYWRKEIERGNKFLTR